MYVANDFFVNEIIHFAKLTTARSRDKFQSEVYEENISIASNN